MDWAAINQRSASYDDYDEFNEWLGNEFLIFNGSESVTFYKPEEETLFLLKWS
jgi:hypothetical protein